MRWFAILFFCVNLFLSSYYIDTWQNGNTTSRALPVVTWNEQGTFMIDKYHEKTGDKAFVNGHYYSEKPPLPILVTIPFFKLLVDVNLITPDANGSLYGKHVYLLGGFLTGSLPFALIVTLAFVAIHRLNSGVSPVVLSMLPFYASYLFVFSGTFFAHVFSGFILLGAFIFLKRGKYFFAGLFAGLAFLSEFNLAVIIFAWGIAILFKTKNLKDAMAYAVGVLPSIAFILVYNNVFTGSPFDFLYKYCEFEAQTHNYGFSFPSIRSVWGLSFSWYRGMFFYVPFLIVFLFSIPGILKSKQLPESFKTYLLLPGLVYFAFISSFFAWWGGWSFGPRLLIALAILLIYESLQFLDFHKIPKVLFWIVVLFGAIVSFMAKATIVYSAPSEIKNPFFKLVLPDFIEGKLHSNNLFNLLFGGSPMTAFVLFIVLFASSVFLLTKLQGKWNPK
jgi:hypothetical protein